MCEQDSVLWRRIPALRKRRASHAKQRYVEEHWGAVGRPPLEVHPQKLEVSWVLGGKETPLSACLLSTLPSVPQAVGELGLGLAVPHTGFVPLGPLL